MKQLFELKIFESIRPNRIRFTAEFSKQVIVISTDYDIRGAIPDSFEYTRRCVYTYLRDVLHKHSDDNELVDDIADSILTLHNAGVIDYDETAAAVLHKLKR